MIGPTTDFPVLDIDELSVNYLAGVWPRWVIVRRASPADMYSVSITLPLNSVLHGKQKFADCFHVVKVAVHMLL